MTIMGRLGRTRGHREASCAPWTRLHETRVLCPGCWLVGDSTRERAPSWLIATVHRWRRHGASRLIRSTADARCVGDVLPAGHTRGSEVCHRPVAAHLFGASNTPRSVCVAHGVTRCVAGALTGVRHGCVAGCVADRGGRCVALRQHTTTHPLQHTTGTRPQLTCTSSLDTPEETGVTPLPTISTTRPQHTPWTSADASRC